MNSSEVALSRNQLDADLRGNELDVEGEARLYRAFRYFWHPVIFSAEVGEGPVRVTLCGEQLVVVRLEDEICVFNDLCAHRGTALSLGEVVENGAALRCPYHGWQYDKSGLCVLAPQRPDLSEHLRARVRKYNAQEAYGMVWVCLEDEPRLPLPEFPMYDDDSYTTVSLECEDWNCSGPRRTENYCDLSHLAFVHNGTLGDINHPEIPDHEVWLEDSCVRMECPFVEPPDSGKYDSLGLSGEVPGAYRWWVSLPLTVRLHCELDAGYNYVLFFHPTPIGPKTIRNFTVGACNYGYEPAKIEAEIRDFQGIVYSEDKPILESQRPEELPEDLSYEMYLRGADTFHLVYRRGLIELSHELVPAGEGSR